VPFLLKDLGAQVAGERITDCSGSAFEPFGTLRARFG